MTANHVEQGIATFPGRDGIGGRTSTSVGFATPNCGLVCSGVVSWGRQLRRSAMWDAVGLVWTATILAYAVIAVARRWAFNLIRQVLEHEGALPHSAQHQPQ